MTEEQEKEWVAEYTRQQADIEACVRLHSRGYLTDKQMGPLAKKMLDKVDRHKAKAPDRFKGKPGQDNG